jgi:hypothetical protein
MKVLGHNSDEEPEARNLPVTAGMEDFSNGQEILNIYSSSNKHYRLQQSNCLIRAGNRT